MGKSLRCERTKRMLRVAQRIAPSAAVVATVAGASVLDDQAECEQQAYERIGDRFLIPEDADIRGHRGKSFVEDTDGIDSDWHMVGSEEHQELKLPPMTDLVEPLDLQMSDPAV